MKKIDFILSLLLLTALPVSLTAQPNQPDNKPVNKTDITPKQTNYEYNILVYEHPAQQPFVCKREIATADRGALASLLDVYRSTFTGKVVNFSAEVLAAGINLIVKAIGQQKENFNNWYKTTQKELQFSKSLPMQTEITDFYQAPSTIGAMDPEGIIFKGFGCQQYAVYKENGKTVRIPVLEIACSLDTTEQGQQRINHHSKFTCVIDSIIFNPYLCNIPNDSLTAEQVGKNMRIPFNFNRRKDLTIQLNVKISSSWMNEAIQVVHDQYLGEFNIKFSIPDSTVLDTAGRWKNYFTWYADRDQNNPHKQVSITGESFVVPRSFICTQMQETDLVSVWGTGQYRVDMSFAESCRINEEYYNLRGKPNDNWKAEWKQMRQRRHYPTFWDDVAAEFTRTFDLQNHQWVHTLLDPVQNAIIVDEQQWLNSIMKTETDTKATSPKNDNAPNKH